MPKAIWGLFKEYVWDFTWGKVVTVATFIIAIWDVFLHLSPNTASKVASKVHLSALTDTRLWYILLVAFLVGLCVWVLYKAAKYKMQIEGEDNIRIVYNQERYGICREVEGNAEKIRVGYRVKGKKSIENPVVFPSQLVSVDKAGKYTQIPITQIPLAPLVPAHQVHPGFKPMHWVNVFIHGLGSNVISLLYENQPAKPIKLTAGEYRLDLVARGASSSGNVGTFIIDVDNNNNLNIVFEGVDQWSTT